MHIKMLYLETVSIVHFCRRNSCSAISDGIASLNNCSVVKTPTALKLELEEEPYKLLYFTTTTILYLFSKIRSATRPMDVEVVTHGGGLLIIIETGASNCKKKKKRKRQQYFKVSGVAHATDCASAV